MWLSLLPALIALAIFAGTLRLHGRRASNDVDRIAILPPPPNPALATRIVLAPPTPHARLVLPFEEDDDQVVTSVRLDVNRAA